LEVNVLGLTIFTREVIRLMRKTNVDGHIVHINRYVFKVFNFSYFKFTTLYQHFRSVHCARAGGKLHVRSQQTRCESFDGRAPQGTERFGYENQSHGMKIAIFAK
jgi:hypothetical protein